MDVYITRSSSFTVEDLLSLCETYLSVTMLLQLIYSSIMSHHPFFYYLLHLEKNQIIEAIHHILPSVLWSFQASGITTQVQSNLFDRLGMRIPVTTKSVVGCTSKPCFYSDIAATKRLCSAHPPQKMLVALLPTIMSLQSLENNARGCTNFQSVPNQPTSVIGLQKFYFNFIVTHSKV